MVSLSFAEPRSWRNRMDPDIAKILANPYASPAAAPPPPPAPAEQSTPRHGSLACIIPGFLLLLVGYLASNFFAIADLYHVGFGPNGQFIPSPLAGVCTTPFLQWLFYGLAASAAIAGCVLVGSQNHNSLAIVCYIMCPLVALVFLAGMPLRIAGRFAGPIATIYLALGTCLAGAGLMRLIGLYGRPNLDFEPMLASLLAEAGLAMVCGALLKLWRSGAFSAPATSQTESKWAAARS
jgi:hypothetical protein